MTYRELTVGARVSATQVFGRVRSAVTVGLRAGRAAAREDWQAPDAARRVLLIDLDSVGLPVNVLPAVLAEVRAAAGPWHAAYAAGHPRSTRVWAICCNMLGVHVLPTTKRKNSADNALIGLAKELADTGTTDFVVISHDGDLARLSGRVTVVTFGRCDLSSKLAQRGDVLRLTLPTEVLTATR